MRFRVLSLGFALALLGTAAAAQPSLDPGDVFRDCDTACPEMVVIPAGRFLMGSEPGAGEPDESPERWVTIAAPFAVGRFEVTFEEWDVCLADGGCAAPWEQDQPGWGRGRRPVIQVDWNEAQAYVRWLGARTGQPYRLLTEAEWEYAARAGTRGLHHTGEAITPKDANYLLSGLQRTVPVGQYPPNPFGLHDMLGNVWEWVADCYTPTPGQADPDLSDDCSLRVMRGGGGGSPAEDVRSARRSQMSIGMRTNSLGFRVARDLAPNPGATQ